MKRRAPNPMFIDETGKVHGVWLVLHRHATEGKALWKSRCQECGSEQVHRGTALRHKPPDCQLCKAKELGLV